MTEADATPASPKPPPSKDASFIPDAANAGTAAVAAAASAASGVPAAASTSLPLPTICVPAAAAAR